MDPSQQAHGYATTPTSSIPYGADVPGYNKVETPNGSIVYVPAHQPAGDPRNCFGNQPEQLPPAWEYTVTEMPGGGILLQPQLNPWWLERAKHYHRYAHLNQPAPQMYPSGGDYRYPAAPPSQAPSAAQSFAQTPNATFSYGRAATQQNPSGSATQYAATTQYAAATQPAPPSSVPKQAEEDEVVKAATTVQAAWRGHKARKEIKEEEQAAVKVQSVWRGHQARKDLGVLLDDDESAVVPPSKKASKAKAGTTAAAAAKVDPAVAGVVPTTAKEKKEMEQAAVTVQAAWRGHQTRKEMDAALDDLLESSTRDTVETADEEPAKAAATDRTAATRGQKTPQDVAPQDRVKKQSPETQKAPTKAPEKKKEPEKKKTLEEELAEIDDVDALLDSWTTPSTRTRTRTKARTGAGKGNALATSTPMAGSAKPWSKARPPSKLRKEEPLSKPVRRRTTNKNIGGKPNPGSVIDEVKGFQGRKLKHVPTTQRLDFSAPVLATDTDNL